jgi:hypothetical protein
MRNEDDVFPLAAAPPDSEQILDFAMLSAEVGHP